MSQREREQNTKKIRINQASAEDDDVKYSLEIKETNGETPEEDRQNR